MMFAKVINECNCVKSMLRLVIANNNNDMNEYEILRKQIHSCCDNETICEFNVFIDKYIKLYVCESDYKLRCMIRDFEPIDDIINYFNDKIENNNNYVHSYLSTIAINTMISNAIKYGNVEVFKFMVINGYFTNTTPYDKLLGICGNAEIFKIIEDCKIPRNKKIINDIMYLFCNPLLVDIDKTFSIVIDMKWIKLFILNFKNDIAMFPNIVCYAIQNDMYGSGYNYMHFVENIIFNNYNTVENYHEIFYDNCRKQIIDTIVNDSNMNESKMFRLCDVFLRNIDTYVLCEKQLYPLVTLFKFIGNRITVLPRKRMLKFLCLKSLNYNDYYTYNKLRILMVISNNYNILHKMMEISNKNKIIKLSYDCMKNVVNYDVYYGNTIYNFKELNIKYLEYIKNHFI